MPGVDHTFLGTFDGGRIKVHRDPIRSVIQVYDEHGNLLGEIEEGNWYVMPDNERSKWVRKQLLEREAEIHELKRPNTQGVIDYLAKIGKEWADGQQAAVLRGAH